MSVSTPAIEKLAIDTIRTLSMDAVQAANSGHPGTPMALAPVAFQLWTETMRYDPAQPLWPNRDRFVLSCGHASMLLYSLIHLAGIRAVDADGNPLDRPSITLDDIKNFRQLHSPCAGHPEYGEAAGIETTTGPLGQGVGNSVGMAIASKWLGARYNRPGFELFNFNTYALCSDGDLMEGVSSEAASLAGHLKLSNLCWIYDDNKITIEGETDLAFSEDVARRFEGLGWQTVRVDDANDLAALSAAYQAFVDCEDRPTLIIVRSVIGYGAPNKANSHAAHGAPLGEDEIRLTKKAYGWPEDAKFLVPAEVLEYFQNTLGKRGAEAREEWESLFQQYKTEFPEEGQQLEAIFHRQLPEGWDAGITEFPADAKGMATRVSSGKVLNMIAPRLPWLVGGSADLAPSTMTLLDGEEDFEASSYHGRNMHFGIREHGMAATLNGMALCGLRPYGATFFVFTDYLRPSLRLSSLMKLPVLYVLTHDSIGLGEDGPTHQPVEHLAACRAIPGLYVYRPADANEVAACYRSIMQQSDRPAALVLSRQGVPTLDRSRLAPAEGALRGGYVVSDCEGEPQVLLIGTGTELTLCLQAQEQLAAEGIRTRVVSLPCQELFDAQPESYRTSVLPSQCTVRVACEAAVRQGWDKYIGTDGGFVGMSTFGASAPYTKLYEHFQITPERIVAEAKARLKS
ncbi:MAG: transketolase [Planctomycetota bacterium]|nr:MAG: transketolase [Planctomycetota bacterium]